MSRMTPSHLSDYLTFNFRRAMATITNESTSSSWTALSSILLAPIYPDLDNLQLGYAAQQWDDLDTDYGAHLLHLIRDDIGQSDAEMATAEVASMARNGLLIHRYREDGTLEVDTVGVLLHRNGITDPRLEFGACVSDKQEKTLEKSD